MGKLSLEPTHPNNVKSPTTDGKPGVAEAEAEVTEAIVDLLLPGRLLDEVMPPGALLEVVGLCARLLDIVWLPWGIVVDVVALPWRVLEVVVPVETATRTTLGTTTWTGSDPQ